MSSMEKALCEGLPRLGLDLPEEARNTLCAFGEAVVEQNKVMNLTAITEPEAVAKLHLLDSLTLLTLEDLQGKRVIDVGCGAGFPGVPVKIACPTMKLTLLDSLGKRMQWLETVLPTLGVDAECITARAEEAVADRRESYDYATSRAVARLNILLELTAPYVKVGGKVLAMKGTAAQEELQEALEAAVEESREAILKITEEDDFIIDGFAIRRFCDLTKVQIKEDKCIEIIKNEGILNNLSAPDIDLTDWHSVFLSLQRIGKNIIVEKESLDDDECEFAIGNIEKVLKNKILFKHFDADGTASG